MRALWLGLTVSLFLTACGGASEKEKPKQAEAPVVSVVTATGGATNGRVRVSGTTAFLREPVLSFRVPGVIQQVAVDEGDQVRAGQRLAWLKPTEVAAGAAEAKAALETAERNLARQQALFENGFVSQARIDDAKLAVERARAGAEAAGFSRDTAIILAPADGVVLRRLAEPSQVAAAGAPILLIGETRSGFIIRASAASQQAAALKIGAKAEVKIRGLGTVTGKVSRLAAKSDAATGAFDIDIAIPAQTGLRSGTVADALIEAGQTNAAVEEIRIPTLALLDARADQGVVFVVDDAGIARRRSVTTGGVDGEAAIVLSGLKPGERVVAAGAAYVRDGEPVTIATGAP
jgi:RND family efflux transporter MFP subunit